MGDVPQHEVDHAKITTLVVNGAFVVPALAIIGWAAIYFAHRFAWIEAWFDEVSRSVLVLAALIFAACFLLLLIRLGGSSASITTHRAWYVAFRQHAGERGLGPLYGRGVTRALDWLDRFVRDAGRADESLWPRAFGLNKPAPLWTVQSYNRCLVLAAAYPLAVVMLGWLWSGHVGPLERALFMRPAGMEQRIVVGGLLVGTMVVGALVALWNNWWEILARVVAVILSSGIVAGGGGSGILALMLLSTWIYRSDRHDLWPASFAGMPASVFLIFGSIYVGLAPVTLRSFGSAGMLSTPIMGLGSYAAVTSMAQRVPVLQRSWRAVLYVSVTLGLLALCLTAPTIAAGDGKSNSWATLYFVGLLTLINAPIDWIALGVTRALLRRGQERGGLWPLGYAVLDIALSLLLMGLLAVLTLSVTIVFNAALARGGWGHSFVDPHATFAALRDPARRLQPEFWWLYAMLFSTQIPALANLGFGCWCGLQGWTPINRWLAKALPEEGSLDVWIRGLAAAAWSAQVAAAFIAGCLGFYWLVWRGAMWVLDALFGAALAGGLGMLAP